MRSNGNFCKLVLDARLDEAWRGRSAGWHSREFPGRSFSLELKEIALRGRNRDRGARYGRARKTSGEQRSGGKMRRCAFYSFNGALPLPSRSSTASPPTTCWKFRGDEFATLREFPRRTSRTCRAQWRAYVNVFTKCRRDANERANERACSFINPAVDYIFRAVFFFPSFSLSRSSLCKVDGKYAARVFQAACPPRETRFSLLIRPSYALGKYSASRSCLKLELAAPRRRRAEDR